METKNVIINDYANSVSSMAQNIVTSSIMLSDNPDRNKAIITTMYNQVESIKNEITLLMSVLDNYNS